jgi:hypothetical protein
MPIIRDAADGHDEIVIGNAARRQKLRRAVANRCEYELAIGPVDARQATLLKVVTIDGSVAAVLMASMPTSNSPVATSCSRGFHTWLAAQSMSVTWAFCLHPSFLPRRVATPRPPAPPPTITILCIGGVQAKDA